MFNQWVGWLGDQMEMKDVPSGWTNRGKYFQAESSKYVKRDNRGESHKGNLELYPGGARPRIREAISDAMDNHSRSIEIIVHDIRIPPMAVPALTHSFGEELALSLLTIGFKRSLQPSHMTLPARYSSGSRRATELTRYPRHWFSQGCTCDPNRPDWRAFLGWFSNLHQPGR